MSLSDATPQRVLDFFERRDEIVISNRSRSGIQTVRLNQQRLFDLENIISTENLDCFTAIFILEKLNELFQMNLELDEDKDLLIQICERLVRLTFGHREIAHLSDWCHQAFKSSSDILSSSSKENNNEIICLVIVRLNLDENLFKQSMSYLLCHNLPMWDALAESIRNAVIDSFSLKNHVLHLFDRSISKSEQRLRIYELGIPLESVWKHFSTDLNTLKSSTDELSYSAHLQALHSVCLNYCADMVTVIPKTDILKTLREQSDSSNLDVLRLLSALPTEIIQACNAENLEFNNEYFEKLMSSFEHEDISAQVCFEHLSSIGAPFRCSLDLQNKLCQSIRCSPSDERIAAMLAVSLVIAEEQFDPDVRSKVCQQVFELSNQPFVDYRLASHRFYGNFAKTNFDLFIKCFPAFYEYLLNSSTEHEIDGLRSKWHLLNIIGELSTNKDLIKVLQQGFGLYNAGISIMNSAGTQTRRPTGSIPRVLDESSM